MAFENRLKAAEDTPSLSTGPIQPSSHPSSGLKSIFVGRNGLRAGWRLLIFTAGLIVLSLGFLQLFNGLLAFAKHAVAAGRAPVELLSPPLVQGVFDLLGFGVVLLLSWLMSRIEGRSVGAYGLPLSRPAASLRRLASGLVVGFLLIFVILLILRGAHVFYFGSLALSGAQIVGWGLLWGCITLAVGFFEESLFRGYALYTLADGISFWPAAVIMGLIFSRGHMGNPGETYVGIAGIMLFALLNSAFLLRTGDLWLPVGLHAGFDWGQSFFFGVSDSGMQAPGHLLNPRVQGPAWLTGGTVGPEASIVTFIMLVLLTAGVLAFYPKRPRVESSR
jgi:membrane protease YdiL (CAAX protease family)